MSFRSRGILSSMTIFMPYFLASSTTPARTSSENGSFSNAMAIFTSDAFLPFFSAISAASVDGAGQILLGRRQHREQVLVALGEQRARCAFGLDHRNLVLFGDRRGGLGGRRAVGSEHELHATWDRRTFSACVLAGSISSSCVGRVCSSCRYFRPLGGVAGVGRGGGGA